MGIEGKKKVEVTERRGRNVTGIMKKKGARKQRDGDENQEDNERKWESRVRKESKRKVTGKKKD